MELNINKIKAVIFDMDGVIFDTEKRVVERKNQEPDMSWNEFCTLLIGIMPKTPLGQIVSIRAEEDKDILKNFTDDQHRIRNEWRNRNNPIINDMTDEEKEKQIKEFEKIMASMFG